MQYFTRIYQKAKAAVHIEILNAIPFFCCQVDVERKPLSFLFSSRIFIYHYFFCPIQQAYKAVFSSDQDCLLFCIPLYTVHIIIQVTLPILMPRLNTILWWTRNIVPTVRIEYLSSLDTFFLLIWYIIAMD